MCVCVSTPALIRREWKSRYDRVMKEAGGPPALDLCDVGFDVKRGERSTTPKRKQGSERPASCPPDCTHNAPLPSDIFIEMKVCGFVAMMYLLLLTEAKVNRVASLCRSC